MRTYYESKQLRDLAVVLAHAGCRTTTGEYHKPELGVYHVFGLASPNYLSVEVPRNRTVYVLYARPGVSLQAARQAAAENGHILPGAPFATLWEYNLAVYVEGRDPAKPPTGVGLLAEDGRFRLWAVTGEATLRPGDIGYRPGDRPFGDSPELWHREPPPAVKVPRFTRRQAELLNRFYAELLGELNRLGCTVSCVEEQSGKQVGPLGRGEISTRWSPGRRWVDTPVVRPPEGDTAAILATRSIVELEAALRAVSLGEPAVINKAGHFAVWLLPPNEDAFPGGLTVITEEQPIDFSWLVE